MRRIHRHVPILMDPCMSGAMKLRRGLARSGLREWALKLVGAGLSGPGCTLDLEGLIVAARRGAARAGRTGGGKTVRSLDPWAHRARCEARSRSCAWSNLEPLKES